jgi:hypothetical protein
LIPGYVKALPEKPLGYFGLEALKYADIVQGIASWNEFIGRLDHT